MHCSYLNLLSYFLCRSARLTSVQQEYAISRERYDAKLGRHAAKLLMQLKRQMPSVAVSHT